MTEQAIRTELYAQQEQLEAALRPYRERISIEQTAEAMDEHIAAESRNVSAETLNLYSRRLGATRLAISKLNNGTYGICEDCDEDISPSRLKARLEAVRCVVCQDQHDQELAARYAAAGSRVLLTKQTKLLI